MAGFNVTRRIEAPVADVFDLFADLEHAAEHVHSIEKIELLTDGPVGAGTRFRETRIMFKKENTEEIELTSFDPPHRYAAQCEGCGCIYHMAFTFTPVAEATDVRVDMRVQPISLLAKIMAPVSALFMGPLRKCTERDLDDLKSVAESRFRDAAAHADSA